MTPKERTPLLILNFHPEPLPEYLVEEIEEHLGRPVQQKLVDFSINTGKYTHPQVLSILDKLRIETLPTNVVFHVPGLPTGAIYLVIDFYARTNQFPTILELVRDEQDRKRWTFGTLRDLNVEVLHTSANPRRSIANKTSTGQGKKSTS